MLQGTFTATYIVSLLLYDYAFECCRFSCDFDESVPVQRTLCALYKYFSPEIVQFYVYFDD